MSDTIRIVATQWRVARDGVSEFPSEDLARRYAAKLNADDEMLHLGVARVQSRVVTIHASHWSDA